MSRPFLDQFAQSGAALDQVCSWDGTAWVPKNSPFGNSPLILIGAAESEGSGAGVIRGTTDGFAMTEHKAAKTGFGVYPMNTIADPTVDPIFKVAFRLRETGSNTNVRIAGRIKSRAIGEDTADPYDESKVDEVTITVTNIGDIFLGTLTFDKAKFSAGDVGTLQIGRDGNEEIAGGSADDFDKSIQVISIVPVIA